MCIHFTGFITDHIAKTEKTPCGVKSVNGTEKSNGENAPAVVVDLDNTPHVTRSRGEAAADTEKAGFSFPAASFQVYNIIYSFVLFCIVVCVKRTNNPMLLS